MNIKLYSTNCPKCKVIEKKLQNLGKDFEIITDMNKVLEASEKANIASAPLLEIDGVFYDFTNANKKINELQ